MNTPRIHMPMRGILMKTARAVALGSLLAAGTALAAPANDDFASAIDLTGVGVDQTGSVTTGTQTGTDNVDATQETGETVGSGVNTVWFKWTSPGDGDLTVTTLGSTDSVPDEFDAVLGIYTGASVGALTPLGGSPQDGNIQEEMTVPVTAGTTYHIQVAGFEGAVAANILLGWNFVATVYEAEILTFGPYIASIGPVVANAANIAWTVPYGANLATLAPTFTLTPGATCTVSGSPVVSGDTVDFSGGPVDFAVTAQGASPTVNTYTVTVTFATALQWNVAGSGVWDTSTANWLPLPSGTATTFANGNEVIFNNADGGTVTVTQGMAPAFITVDSASGKTYKLISGVLPNGVANSIASGTLIKNGSGTLQLGDDTLSANLANIYSNDFSSVTINAGMLKYGSKDALGTGTVTLGEGVEIRKFGQEGNGPTVGLFNNIQLNGAVTAYVDSGTKDQFFGGKISGTGSLIIKSPARTINLSGNNDFSGGVVLENPSNRTFIAHVNALGTGTLTINKIGVSGNGLEATANLSAGVGVANNVSISTGATFNVGGTGTTNTLRLSGVISGADGVLNTVRGNTVILDGANTYGGGTIVNIGTLTIGSLGSLADATMAINGGNVNGTGTMTFNINGLASDLIDLNSGSLDISGLNIAINAFGTGLTEDAYVLVDYNGTGSISGTQFASLAGAGGYTIDYNYLDGNQIALVSIPEPSVLSLGCLAVLGLLRRR